jgi:hypothetical protein
MPDAQPLKPEQTEEQHSTISESSAAVLKGSDLFLTIAPGS